VTLRSCATEYLLTAIQYLYPLHVPVITRSTSSCGV